MRTSGSGWLLWGAIALLVLAAGVIVVWSQSTTGDGPVTIGGSTRPAAQEPSGPKVADFSLPDVKGQSVNLKQFVGGRPLVMSFGSTYCPACSAQFVALKEVRSKLGDRVAILEIDVGEPVERVAAHLARIQSPFTTLIDRDGSVFLRYGRATIPVTVVADGSGRIISHGGYTPAQELIRTLETALKSNNQGT